MHIPQHGGSTDDQGMIRTTAARRRAPSGGAGTRLGAGPVRQRAMVREGLRRRDLALGRGHQRCRFGGQPVGSGRSSTIDTGYVLGAALGYDYTTNFALELEYAYRNAGTSGDSEADASSNALMLNVLYKFNPMGANGQIQPYIGGGLGVANLDVHEDEVGSFKTDGDFAYQAIAGVAYHVESDVEPARRGSLVRDRHQPARRAAERLAGHRLLDLRPPGGRELPLLTRRAGRARRTKAHSGVS